MTKGIKDLAAEIHNRNETTIRGGTFSTQVGGNELSKAGFDLAHEMIADMHGHLASYVKARNESYAAMSGLEFSPVSTTTAVSAAPTSVPGNKQASNTRSGKPGFSFI